MLSLLFPSENGVSDRKQESSDEYFNEGLGPNITAVEHTNSATCCSNRLKYNWEWWYTRAIHATQCGLQYQASEGDKVVSTHCMQISPERNIDVFSETANHC